jgi:SAM-dependent methyltransferase
MSGSPRPYSGSALNLSAGRYVVPMHEEHYAINRAYWDERAPVHADSADYAVAQLVADPTRLSDVVRFDLPRLGDISGLRGVHLQCHIGTDTLSLHRLGAAMTGVDFSPASLDIARRLANDAGADINFVESDVYGAPDVMGTNSFDFVFTGIGALCWLPDIQRWARTVAALLRPGGRLFLREGHPMTWALDETRTDALVLGYPYFGRPDPDQFDDPGTYVETDAQFSHTASRAWNHGLGEIVTAVLQAGLELTMLVEHDSVPWEALPGRMRLNEGEWRLVEHPERLPLTYTLQAVKR